MRYLIALFFLTVTVLDAQSAVFHIERNRDQIYDHANPNQTGTIAWYFKTKGANNRFVLSTPSSGGSYAITKPLFLPEGSTLESGSDKAWIRAYGDIDFMLRPSNESTISNVIFDGNYLATSILHGPSVKGFQLDNSVIRRTVNTYNSNHGSRTRAHGVVMIGAEDLTISNNVITNIGDSGQNVANNVKVEASGLLLTEGDRITVTGNTISYTLSAGINTTNSREVTITHNTIDNVGRSGLYGGLYAADGITAYHNERFGPNENLYYDVTYNTITNWYNHGVHLSGRWLNISHNNVSSPGHNPGGTINANNQINTTGHAIFVGDYRHRVRCSSIIWIQNNFVERSRHHPTDAADGIRAQHYKHSAYWPSSNTGDVGSSVNVTDHRYANLIPATQESCPLGYADEHY